MSAPRPAGAVLGTAVHDLGDDDGPAVLLSDLHVPQDGGAVVERLGALLDVAARDRLRVFVLGDLFDSYVSPAQLRVGVWRDVAARCRAAVAAGAPLVLLHGNRDFLLGPEFERATGARVVAGGVRCVLAGRRALLLHGDELCQNDLPYQRARRWLRHPVTKLIARRLPLRLALAVAARARRRSRTVIAAGDPTRFAPTVAAVQAAFACCELLVFGHVHAMARGPFAVGSASGEYCVLPAFDHDGVGLHATGGVVRFVRVAGEDLVPVADPPPRTFAAARTPG